MNYTTIIIHCLFFLTLTTQYKIILQRSQVAENFELGSKRGYEPTKYSTSSLSLVIFVVSAPFNKGNREAIRKTWGHRAELFNIPIYYVIGQSLSESLKASSRKEAHRSDSNVIQMSFVDTYRNLTLKTLSIFKWVQKCCKDVSFILKCDDDVFVNIDLLRKFISSLNPKKKAIYGQVLKNTEAVRDPFSKSFVNYVDYPETVYPDYVNGPSYLIPQRLIGLIYRAALAEKLFPMEDVFLTGFIAKKKLGFKLRHQKYFCVSRSVINLEWMTKAITIHGVDALDQYRLLKMARLVTDQHFSV